jgi:hypothetical protein
MKVKALKLFNDLEMKKLRKPGEIFDVSPKRAGELNAGPHGVLIEVIEVIDKQESGEADERKNKIGAKNKKLSV